MTVERQRFTFTDLNDIVSKAMALQGRQIKMPEDRNVVIADLGVDSLAVVQILMDIQSRYGVEIPAEDVPKLTTVGQTMDYVNQHMKA
jgi:acyl carrier protein